MPMKTEQTTSCYECGQYLTIVDYRHDNEAYCQDCFHKLFIKCHECEDFFDKDDSYTANDGDTYCSDCYWQIYTLCHACEDVILIDGVLEYGSNCYCPTCYHERFIDCDNCGEAFSIEDISGGQCQDCYCRHRSHIGSGSNQAMISNTCQKTNGFKRMFSVEVECYRHSDAMSDAMEGDSHCYVDEDGSLGDDGEEHKLGILQGDQGVDYIQSHCRTLQSYGYSVDDSCGLHVHVDTRDITPKEATNIISFVCCIEDLIYQLSGRIGSEYANPTAKYYTSDKRQDLKHWLGTNNERAWRLMIKDMPRCLGMNLQPYFTQGTIEFRYAEGDINPVRVPAWAIFCLHIVEIGRLKHWDFKATPRKLLRLLRLPKWVEESLVSRNRKLFA